MALETEQWHSCGTETSGGSPMTETKRLDTDAVRPEF
jgi:hypothetical protein